MNDTRKIAFLVMAFVERGDGERFMRYAFHSGSSPNDVLEQVRPVFESKYPDSRLVLQALQFRTEDLDWAAQVVAESQDQADDVMEFDVLDLEYLI